ncbi:MAG: 30S ribosomal protein S1 [Ruminococcaceae bacterium]|nr:30S ribosomal protein S1 [Oscillospiraceae bacterium]
MIAKYLPEGCRTGRRENSRYLCGIKGIEEAYLCGAVIEDVALRCNNDMSLEFDLGGIRGYMPRHESAYVIDDIVKDIAVITRVGKAVCFKVINIIKDEKGRDTAILSRRAAQKQCLEEYLYDLIPGDIIPAKVTHLESFGAFVDIGCGIVSLLPIDSISVSRISHPTDRFEVGSNIYTVIKSIDPDRARFCVSHKELLGSWEENASRFRVGQTVAGIIRSIEEYGIFVELSPNLAGLAEYRSGAAVGKCASVYIKSIFPERMKVKLVLIDISDSNINKNTEYFITPEKVQHIDRFRYSPTCCDRVIETVF